MDILTQLKKYSLLLISNFKIALDIGTSLTRLAIAEKGVVLRQPTIIGINTRSKEYLYFGDEAKQIYGKAPNFINVVKPIQGAIISDFDSTVALIDHFLKKSVFPYYLEAKLIRLKLFGLTGSPAIATEVEQKALQEALLKAGFTEVKLVEKVIATAYGANLPVFSSNPSFIVDFGGGLIEMAVIVSGGIVSYKGVKNAGEHMDKLIKSYLHLKHGILTGEATCERLKIELLTYGSEINTMTIRGKSLEDGLPKSIRVKSFDIKEALAPNINQIVDNIKELLESVPPEIIDGIIKSGITITGGLANVTQIDRYISSELKVPIYVAKSPTDSTVLGLLRLLGEDKYKNITFSSF